MSIAPDLDSEWHRPPTAILLRRRLRPVPPPVPLTPLLGRAAVAAAIAAGLIDPEAVGTDPA